MRHVLGIMKKFILNILAAAGLALTAQGHPPLQDAMWVQFEPADIRMAVNVSLREINVAQNLSTNSSSDELSDGVLARQGDYVLAQLKVSAGNNLLSGAMVKFTRPQSIGEPEQTFFQYELVYPFTGPPPAEVTFENDMLKGLPYAMGTPWNVSYVIRAKRAGDNSATTWLLGYEQPATIPTGWETPNPVVSPTPKSQGWRTFCEYLRHGIMHILTGWDHLLFVSALVIATRSFWEMVKVIAAFTLAHSLTLTLCVFGIFRLPAFIVEPVIALSIVFVALENLFWPQRAHSRIRLAVAFGFGLVHGLGFAGGLLDAMAGLPAIGTWIALGAFSLGVEIGHQIVVLPLFGLLTLSRHKISDKASAALLRYSTSAISVCGVYYLFVAVHEQFFTR
jgi:hydrogenase/urease accessory protein HupE